LQGGVAALHCLPELLNLLLLRGQSVFERLYIGSRDSPGPGQRLFRPWFSGSLRYQRRR